MGYSDATDLAISVLDKFNKKFVLMVRDGEELGGEFAARFIGTKSQEDMRDEDIYYITFLIQILIDRFKFKLDSPEKIDLFKRYFNQICNESIDKVIEIENLPEELC